MKPVLTFRNNEHLLRRCTTRTLCFVRHFVVRPHALHSGRRSAFQNYRFTEIKKKKNDRLWKWSEYEGENTFAVIFFGDFLSINVQIIKYVCSVLIKTIQPQSVTTKFRPVAASPYGWRRKTANLPWRALSLSLLSLIHISEPTRPP